MWNEMKGRWVTVLQKWKQEFVEATTKPDHATLFLLVVLSPLLLLELLFATFGSKEEE